MAEHTGWSEDLEADLRAPFPKKHIAGKKKGGTYIPYIPWFRIVQRLNHLVGPQGWEDGEPILKEVNDRLVVGTPLTILGVTKINFGDELLSVGMEFQDEETGKYKTRGYGTPITNAQAQGRRRTAAEFGIGLYLYDDQNEHRRQAERWVREKDGGKSCPKCGGGVWDNRNDPDKADWPDYKCRDQDGCGWIKWNADEDGGDNQSEKPQPSKNGQDQPSGANGDAPGATTVATTVVERYNAVASEHGVQGFTERVFWVGNPEMEANKVKNATDADFETAIEHLTEFGDAIVGKARQNVIRRVRQYVNRLTKEDLVDVGIATPIEQACEDEDDEGIIQGLATLYEIDQEAKQGAAA